MTDLLTHLGLRSPTLSTTPTPNYAAHFILANFLLTYIVGAPRILKTISKIDNNISPRGDLGAQGDAAVASKKITQSQLDRLRRMQAAHENGMEHFPVFLGAVVMATIARVENATVNKYALMYTLVRGVYTGLYVFGTTEGVAGVRSVVYWVANVVCIRLLWFAGKGLNDGRY